SVTAGARAGLSFLATPAAPPYHCGRRNPRSPSVPKLFGVTLFVSATLLFLVQPMVGKMILPLLGGTPAVWNTCMVFYQALLLAGYYYAHKVSTSYDSSRQTRIHLILLCVAVATLALGTAIAFNHSP